MMTRFEHTIEQHPNGKWEVRVCIGEERRSNLLGTGATESDARARVYDMAAAIYRKLARQCDWLARLESGNLTESEREHVARCDAWHNANDRQCAIDEMDPLGENPICDYEYAECEDIMAECEDDTN